MNALTDIFTRARCAFTAATCAMLSLTALCARGETEEFVLSSDVLNLENPAYASHFKARDGSDAPVGWYVQRLVSGYDEESGMPVDKYAPPTTNTAAATGEEVYGSCLPFYGAHSTSNAMEYHAGATFIGDRAGASVYADTGMPGFVSASIGHPDSMRHAWLRAFSAPSIRAAAYYGDAKWNAAALDKGGQINYQWNPRDPRVDLVNPAYQIPFAVAPAVKGDIVRGRVRASRDGANNELPAAWIVVEHRIEGQTTWTTLDQELDAQGSFSGPRPATSYPVHVRARVKDDQTPRPGFPVSRPVLLNTE